VTGQGRYLFDTNVLSETWKPKANQGVIEFLRSTEPTSAFISVLTIGELRKGVAAKKLRDRDSNAATRLAAWVEGIELSFADRILGIDTATVRLWGEWSGERARPVVDTLLAATAVLNDLTLVTRNLRDVRGIPVKLLDPWTA
jgi:predicted nucleic acid-binding protein